MKADFIAEYSDVSKWHWWFKGRKNIVSVLFKKYLNSKKRINILDIGCGPVDMLSDFMQFGKVYGIDSNQKAVYLCREKGRLDTCLSSVNNLPFKNAAFGGVLALDVLEHLDYEAGALHEIIRVSKPGGLVVITVPAFNFLWSSHDIINGHKRRYTINNLRALLDTQALQIIKISYFNFILFPIIAAIRIFKKLNIFNRVGTNIKSDFALAKPGIINNILSVLFSLESKLIPFLNFPFGSSIVCVLVRKE